MVWGKYLESVNVRAECKCKGMVLGPKHACHQEGGGGCYTSYESQIACVFVRNIIFFWHIKFAAPKFPSLATFLHTMNMGLEKCMPYIPQACTAA